MAWSLRDANISSGRVAPIATYIPQVEMTLLAHVVNRTVYWTGQLLGPGLFIHTLACWASWGGWGDRGSDRIVGGLQLCESAFCFLQISPFFPSILLSFLSVLWQGSPLAWPLVSVHPSRNSSSPCFWMKPTQCDPELMLVYPVQTNVIMEPNRRLSYLFWAFNTFSHMHTLLFIWSQVKWFRSNWLRLRWFIFGSVAASLYTLERKGFWVEMESEPLLWNLSPKNRFEVWVYPVTR